MKNASAGNAGDSAMTSPTEARRPHRESESEYLARQSAEARLAMAETLRDIGRTLERGAHEHPLITIGAAAATGTLAGRWLSAPGRDGDHARHEPSGSRPGLLDETLEPIVADLAKMALGAVAEMLTATFRFPADKEHGQAPDGADAH